MKPSQQQVNTNQTSVSNKRSSNYNYSSNNKSVSRNSNNKSYDSINTNKNSLNNNNNNSHSFQLPKIHRSSNIDTTSNKSYDMQHLSSQKQNYLNSDKLSEIQESSKEEILIGVVNYDKMTMEQIKREYERLRKQFNTLTNEIKKSQQIQISRVTKKSRAISTIQTQKILAKTEQQLYENSLLLQKLKLQYQQLDRRSNLANSSISRPNAQLNEKIIKLKQKILTTKDKIKLLRKRTKKSGQDILNGQDVHQVLQRLQRQSKNYESKLASLQGKLQQSKFKIQRQDQKLQQIQKTYTDAQDYMKLFKLQNEQQQQRTVIQKQYRQLKHKQQIIKKKIQSDQQTFIQKYHQLLKLLQTQTQKQQLINKKLIQEDIKILKARNGVLDFQKELETLQQILTRFKQQQEMKKQTQILKKAIQGVNNTHQHMSSFITQTNNTNQNTNIAGSIRNNKRNIQNISNSIMEENQSQLYDTIQGNSIIKNTQSHQKNYNEQQKTVEKEQNLINSNNYNNITNKGIDSKEQRYYLPAKDIVKRRQQQKKQVALINSQMKRQPSNNDVKTGRKVHSLMKAREIDSSSTLRLKQHKQHKQNEVSNNNIHNYTTSTVHGVFPSNNSKMTLKKKDSNEKHHQQQIDNNNQKVKQSDSIMLSNQIGDNKPYINLSKNRKIQDGNNFERQLQKGKQGLRQRKNSNSDQYLKQLELLNQQLLKDNQQYQQNQDPQIGNNSNINLRRKQQDNQGKGQIVVKEQGTNSLKRYGRKSQQSNRSSKNTINSNNKNKNKSNDNNNNNRNNDNRNTINNKNNNRDKQQNQDGVKKVKKNQSLLYRQKVQVFDKIDRTNIEYGRRIEQLKRQINTNTNTKDMVENINGDNKEGQRQKQQIVEKGVDRNIKDERVQSDSNVGDNLDDIDDDIDGDIDDDIEQINEMVRKKRGQNNINNMNDLQQQQ